MQSIEKMMLVVENRRGRGVWVSQPCRPARWQTAAVRDRKSSAWHSPRPARSAPRCWRTPSCPQSPTWLQLMMMLMMLLMVRMMKMDVQCRRSRRTEIWKCGKTLQQRRLRLKETERWEAWQLHRKRWDDMKRKEAAPLTASLSPSSLLPPSLSYVCQYRVYGTCAGSEEPIFC